jgi:hypothetical protein
MENVFESDKRNVVVFNGFTWFGVFGVKKEDSFGTCKYFYTLIDKNDVAIGAFNCNEELDWKFNKFDHVILEVKENA